MAHPTFSRLRRFRLSLLSLSLLACGSAWAQLAPQHAPSAVATSAPSRHMIAEIQVIPRPAGTAADRYKHVDAAIAVIQASGLHYEVHTPWARSSKARLRRSGRCCKPSIWPRSKPVPNAH